MMPVEPLMALMVAIIILMIIWALHEKKRVHQDSEARLELKLQIIELEKAIRDEQRRAEEDVYELRQHFHDQHMRLTQQLLVALERPERQEPDIYLNGQLLQPNADYQPVRNGEGLVFALPLRPQDVLMIRRNGGPTQAVPVGRPVGPGEVFLLEPTEPSPEEVRAALRKVVVEQAPEPPSRYDLIMEDDEGPQEPAEGLDSSGDSRGGSRDERASEGLPGPSKRV